MSLISSPSTYTLDNRGVLKVVMEELEEDRHKGRKLFSHLFLRCLKGRG